MSTVVKVEKIKTPDEFARSDDQSKAASSLNVEFSTDIDPVIFRAYDIRGIVKQNLNEDVIRCIGHAVGSEAKDRGQTKLVVGRDGRLSSQALSHALIEGLLRSGCDVIDVGELATPILYFACEQLKTYSGIMVTGSHNSADYNGLKILLGGESLSGEGIQKIYQRIKHSHLHSGAGSLSLAEVRTDYIQRIQSDIDIAKPIKLVIDCGNGIAGAVAPSLFKALGCEVIELFCDVDGNFPNHHPNPGQPENLIDLSEAVQQHDAELGIAFDGDGDRIGVVDSNGDPIWPDRLMMLFSQDVLSRAPGSIILYDVKSTNLLGEEISAMGGEAIMWKSGHALIKNKMKEVNAQLAGELSGHIFFKERWYGFDDALYAASRLLEIISNDIKQRTAVEIFSALPSRVSTPEIMIEMQEGESGEFMAQLRGGAFFNGAELILIDGLRAEYENGWGLVRSSNTTPGITLRFEADTQEELLIIQQTV